MSVINKTKKQTKFSYLAQNIKKLLEHTSISLSDLSRETGIPKTTLSALINDVNADPRLGTLHPIAKFFDKSIEELLCIDMNLSQTQDKPKALPIIEWDEIKDFINNNKKTLNYYTIETDVKTGFVMKSTKSLRPRFLDNTLLIFDLNKQYNDSDIVVVQDNEFYFSLKEIYCDGTKTYFLPLSVKTEEKILFHPNKHNIIAVLVNSVITY